MRFDVVVDTSWMSDVTRWLTILFVAFKVLGIVDWSWRVTLIPVWVQIGVFVLFGIFRTLAGSPVRQQDGHDIQ